MSLPTAAQEEDEAVLRAPLRGRCCCCPGPVVAASTAHCGPAGRGQVWLCSTTRGSWAQRHSSPPCHRELLCALARPGPQGDRLPQPRHRPVPPSGRRWRTWGQSRGEGSSLQPISPGPSPSPASARFSHSAQSPFLEVIVQVITDVSVMNDVPGTT